MSEFIPLSIRIKTATQKLKDYGYVVVNTNDEKFAILAEKKRIICNNYTEFFKTVSGLTEKTN